MSEVMPKPAQVLLVEDSRMDVELTLNAFHEAKLMNSVHVVRDGQSALDYLFGQDPYSDRQLYPCPDLILLDLKMPGMDGFDVLRCIKTAHALKRIPVIILTSSKEEGDRAMAYDIGANSYLVKPISFGGFLYVIGQIESYWLTLNVTATSEFQ